MKYSDRWEIIGAPLGEGGQGKVYRVLDKTKFLPDYFLWSEIRELIYRLSNTVRPDQDNLKENYEKFRKGILSIVQREEPSNYCALKVLHKPEDARDPERAKERIKREIGAMSKVSNPNLIKILDFDTDGEWFVSKYYPKGSLARNLEKFKGNFLKALRAFRPLVEGVAELHKNDIVHRDIKPNNVFFDENDDLIPGDFGIVFFTDKQHTRISDTLDNVGSRNWMPSWAQGRRIEDINFKFDVFSLGKLLWSMISGSPFLLLWYYDKPEYDLERMFPNDNSIQFTKYIFRNCIVENEENCLLNASVLLKKVEDILFFIENNVEPIDPNIERRCKVCGIGVYKKRVGRDEKQKHERPQDWGLFEGDHLFKVFTCSHCGHVQIFALDPGMHFPEAWEV